MIAVVLGASSDVAAFQNDHIAMDLRPAQAGDLSGPLSRQRQQFENGAIGIIAEVIPDQAQLGRCEHAAARRFLMPRMLTTGFCSALPHSPRRADHPICQLHGPLFPSCFPTGRRGHPSGENQNLVGWESTEQCLKTSGASRTKPTQFTWCYDSRLSGQDLAGACSGLGWVTRRWGSLMSIAETKAARLSTAKYTGVKALRRPAACISKADYLRTAKASLNSRGRYRMTISRRHDSSHECDRHRLQSRSA